MLVDGGVMLCTGKITPVSGSSELMVTGQKSISDTVKGARLMIVVIVMVTEPLDEYRPVAYGGHVKVRGVASGIGGKMSVQGGSQPTVGVGSTQTSGST